MSSALARQPPSYTMRPPDGVPRLSPPAGSRKQADGCLPVSVGDGFPDQFGDIDDEIRSLLARVSGCTDLAADGADDVVEPAIGLAVGQVIHRPDDLAAFWRVGPAVPVPLDHDRGPVVGLDDGAEVRPERPV